MGTAMTREQVIEQLTSDRKYALQAVAKWTEKFAALTQGRAMLTALEGTQELFDLVARADAIEFALLFVNDLHTELHDVVRTLEKEVLNNAKWPTHSTSPLVNYASQCKQARLAQVVHDLQLWTREVAGR